MDYIIKTVPGYFFKVAEPAERHFRFSVVSIPCLDAQNSPVAEYAGSPSFKAFPAAGYKLPLSPQRSCRKPTLVIPHMGQPVPFFRKGSGDIHRRR
ncbi:hypothetical protein RHDC3_01372 [Rhodocyclaceae bacterium]|nr:hypothetical protein RHDC3_01372 [Rhodocyclaceae bacterium]